MATAKTTTSKTTAKKSAVSKEAKKATEATSLDSLANRMLDAADAGLGFYGTLFDTAQARIEELREDAPKRLEAYIERGQKMRKDVSKAIEGQDFPTSFDKDELREQMENTVEKVKGIFKPATA